jgi:hypothetical protein
MAQFLPPIDPETMEFGSEADFARAMQKQLDEGYLVMHSLPWVCPARDDVDAPAREGEADFLVLHRQYGLLIIEVKGGEIALKRRIWYRYVKAGLKEIKDPVRQARRSLWALKKRIELVCGKAVADQTIMSVAVGRSRFDRTSYSARLQGRRGWQARTLGSGIRRGAPGIGSRIPRL